MQISAVSTVSTWLFAMSNLCNMCNCEWQWHLGVDAPHWGTASWLLRAFWSLAPQAASAKSVCLAFWVWQVDPAAGHSFYPRLIQQMEESCFKTIPFASLYIPLHIFVLYFGLVSRTLKECVMCFMFLASFGTRKDINMGNSISNRGWFWQVLRCLHACWFYTVHPSQDDLEHTFTYPSQSLVLMVSAFRVLGRSHRNSQAASKGYAKRSDFRRL